MQKAPIGVATQERGIDVRRLIHVEAGCRLKVIKKDFCITFNLYWKLSINEIWLVVLKRFYSILRRDG